jgi:outer membrane protein
MSYWVSAAEASNYQVVQAAANLDSQEKEVDHTRAGRYPTVDLVASVSKQNFSQSGLNVLGTGGKQAEIGILLSVPIWDGGLRSSTIRQSIAGADQAREDLQATRESAAQSARLYYTGVTSAIAQARALEQAVASARISLEGSIRGQQVGTRTAVDVLNARQQYFQIQRQLAAARYTAILETLQLKANAGTLSPKDLEGLTSAGSSSALSPPEPLFPHN